MDKVKKLLQEEVNIEDFDWIPDGGVIFQMDVIKDKYLGYSFRWDLEYTIDLRVVLYGITISISSLKSWVMQCREP